jgi:hypothetical protein
MNKDLNNLIKAITTLVQMTILYCFVTWTYTGLQFVIGSFTG